LLVEDLTQTGIDDSTLVATLGFAKLCRIWQIAALLQQHLPQDLAQSGDFKFLSRETKIIGDAFGLFAGSVFLVSYLLQGFCQFVQSLAELSVKFGEILYQRVFS